MYLLCQFSIAQLDFSYNVFDMWIMLWKLLLKRQFITLVFHSGKDTIFRDNTIFTYIYTIFTYILENGHQCSVFQNVLFCSPPTTDSRCIHGGEHGTTVYQVPAGGTEEQQAWTSSSTDQTAGDEPHDCPTGNFHTTNIYRLCDVWIISSNMGHCVNSLGICSKCKWIPKPFEYLFSFTIDHVTICFDNISYGIFDASTLIPLGVMWLTVHNVWSLLGRNTQGVVSSSYLIIKFLLIIWLCMNVWCPHMYPFCVVCNYVFYCPVVELICKPKCKMYCYNVWSYQCLIVWLMSGQIYFVLTYLSCNALWCVMM